MQSEFVKKITQAYSSERVNAYCSNENPDDLTSALATYAWNLALSTSFYPSLQNIEVVLRNTLYRVIAEEFNDPHWFNNSQILHPQELKYVTDTRRKLEIAKKAHNPNHIVSELNFGFWTSLLDRRYEQHLWPKLLKQAFPYIPRSNRTRNYLSKRFNKIRKLRNRVFHHQRIWHWHDLSDQHGQILEAIGWIEPKVTHFLDTLDEFDDVYSKGANHYSRALNKVIIKS